MIALRPFSLPASLTLSWTLTLAIVAGSGSAQAQATKPVVPPTTKEKAKKTEKEAPKAAEPIDLNSATAEELMTLPGIGEASARKIIDARPHKAVADLADHGIPARTIDGIKALVVVRPLPVAVDLNTDALNRIETLPGVGPTLAKEVIAARPFAGYDDLAKVKGFGPAKIEALKGRVKFGKAEPAAKAKLEPKAEPSTKTKAEAPKAETTTAKKAEVAKAEATTRTKAEPKATTSKEAGLTGAKVNLNTASLEELDALPGIGPVRAQAIVDGRPYAKIEDIMKVKGIKEVEFGKVKDRISVAK